MATVDTPSVQHSARYSSGSVPVYYDYLEPTCLTKPAIVLIHGGTQNGSCYLRTIDGRPGWAYRFAERGYTAAIPDWPGTGRSCYVRPERLTGQVICQGLAGVLEDLNGPVILLVHSMAGAFGWHLAAAYPDRVQAIVAVAPAPPGDMQVVPEIASESATEISIRGLHRPMTLPRSDFAPDRAFVTEKLVGASRYFPAAKLDHFLVTLRPIPQRLLYERWNIDGSQLTVGNAHALKDKPILVVTGTEDMDHSREIDGAVVKWLNDTGASAEFLYLGDKGIVGNGHMVMAETNSDLVADAILEWLARQQKN